MNDRFRFRAWNKEEKKMYYDAQDAYDYMTGKPIIFATSFGCLLTNDEEWEVEQCTGLKDKNGNLIYEGDIVQYWWNQKTNTGTIFWNNEFARFCIANNETHCPEDSNCLMFVSDKKIIEIIGNIHKQAEQKDVK